MQSHSFVMALLRYYVRRMVFSPSSSSPVPFHGRWCYRTLLVWLWSGLVCASPGQNKTSTRLRKKHSLGRDRRPDSYHYLLLTQCFTLLFASFSISAQYLCLAFFPFPSSRDLHPAYFRSRLASGPSPPEPTPRWPKLPSAPKLFW